MIEARDLNRSYPAPDGERAVLRGLDLDVPAGAMVALVGRSGSGKTTLLSILGGLDDGFTGSVSVDGHELGGLADRALSRFRGQTVGMVFQGAYHVAHLSCLDNVCLPALFTEGSAPRPWSAVRDRARDLLDTVGLAGYSAYRPGRLSGGQRQRLGIARALLNEPSLLLCDEITGNLDPATAAGVIELLVELNRSRGLTVLLAAHDRDVATAADTVLALANGRLHPSPVEPPGTTGGTP